MLRVWRRCRRRLGWPWPGSDPRKASTALTVSIFAREAVVGQELEGLAGDVVGLLGGGLGEDDGRGVVAEADLAGGVGRLGALGVARHGPIQHRRPQRHGERRRAAGGRHAFSTFWSQLSGPGVVSFDDPGSPATRAVFPVPGTYTLRLTGNDSHRVGTDDVIITVNASPALVGATLSLAAAQRRPLRHGHAAAAARHAAELGRQPARQLRRGVHRHRPERHDRQRRDRRRGRRHLQLLRREPRHGHRRARSCATPPPPTSTRTPWRWSGR